MAGIYDKALYAGTKLKIVESDAEILVGIWVHHVPGHTPGTQAVSIDMPKGKAVITGFCSTLDVFNPLRRSGSTHRY